MNFRRPLIPRSLAFFLTALAVLPCFSFGSTLTSADVEGEWQGVLAGKFRIVFRITQKPEDGLSATLISLDQGGQEVPFDKVAFSDGNLALEIKTIGGSYKGTLSADANNLKGQWTQGGTLPLDMIRSQVKAAPVSVLEPRPPFPYQVEDVTFGNPQTRIELAGTFTYPRTKGPFPAVLLIQGSGKVDRDETVHGHKPFLLLADALTRAGLAVLRFDKRGVGTSTGNYETYTSQDMAQDVRWGLDYLKGRREVDPKRMGLLGHSEGGLIAPMVAADSPDVSFIVLLAAPGIKGDELVVLQSASLLRQAGEMEVNIIINERVMRRIIDILRSGGTDEAHWERCQKALKEEVRLLKAADRLVIGEDRIDMTLADFQRQKPFLLSPWFRSFIDQDPGPSLSKVRCPVLALFGEKDLQVPPAENHPALETALKKGKTRDLTVRTLPGLNHLFQTCRTCSLWEYASLPETMAPSALKLITDWVVARTR